MVVCIYLFCPSTNALAKLMTLFRYPKRDLTIKLKMLTNFVSNHGNLGTNPESREVKVQYTGEK